MTDADTSAEAVERRVESLEAIAGLLARGAPIYKDDRETVEEAAATLRALAAERDALQEVVDVRTMIGTARLEEDRDRLAAENARLLDAVRQAIQCIADGCEDEADKVLRAALTGDTRHE